MKSKKIGLLTSLASICLCGGALVGTSLAWFTDVASNNGNIIQVGNFDLQLQKYDEEKKQYVSAEGDDVHLFDSNNVWEPDEMQVAYLGFYNAGNINLQYTVDVNVYDYTGTTPIGSLFEFALIYSYNADNGTFTNWTNNDDTGFMDYPDKYPVVASSFVGPVALEEQKYSMGTGDLEFTHLAARETQYLALAIHMKQDASLPSVGEEAPSFKVDFTVRAKQDKPEAEFPNVTTNEELQEAIEDLKEGDRLILSPNLTIDQDILIDESDVTIVGNGANFNVEKGKHIQIATDANDVVIEGLDFYGGNGTDSNNRSQAIELQNGTHNVTIENCNFYAGNGGISNAIFTNSNDDGGKLVIKNNYFERAINLSDVGNTVYNAEITGNVFNPAEGVNCITTAGSLENVVISGNRYEGSYQFWRLYQSGDSGIKNAEFTNVSVKDNYLPNLTDVASPDSGAEAWWEENRSLIDFSGNVLKA